MPPSGGTLPTQTPLFVVVLIGTVLTVGALTFVPALALGPVVEALDAGADDYLTKPFGVGELLARVLAARRLARSGRRCSASATWRSIWSRVSCGGREHPCT